MGTKRMFDFIADLDDYFCEKYANYDKLCVLTGYRMPKMHATETRADGRTYSYTLPSENMRLALQENKTELLKELKSKMHDKTFSFSFVPLGFFNRLSAKYSKTGFCRTFKQLVLNRKNLTAEEVGAELSIDSEIWNNVCKGNFQPTKNLLLTIALTAHLSLEETEWLLASVGYEWDYTIEKDVVITYLLHAKVYNAHMIRVALAEYKIGNLYFKEETEK